MKLSKFLYLVLYFCSVLIIGCNKSSEEIKIGFMVKQPEEHWFQNEWKFARQASSKYGFKLIEIGATDGEKVLSGIDNLAAQGVQGFVICAPDVKLGPAIVAKAKANNLRLMSVDDRFIGSDGKFIEEVPHMGISAYKIGEIVGQVLFDEIKNRCWKLSEVGAVRISYNELATAKERIDGATAILLKNGFLKSMVFDIPQKTTDVEGGLNAANITLTKKPDIKHWVIFGVNDETVLGGVRATEGRGYKAADVVGVGIGGSGTATVEFKKNEPTGFFATVLISPKRHGYETVEAMYHWIKENKQPESVIYTTGILIKRDNYKQIIKEQGLDE